MSDDDLEKELKRLIHENQGLAPNALLGKVMGALRGKADGKKIVEMLGRLVSLVKTNVDKV